VFGYSLVKLSAVKVLYSVVGYRDIMFRYGMS
jgi:hypothetical protein